MASIAPAETAAAATILRALALALAAPMGKRGAGVVDPDAAVGARPVGSPSRSHRRAPKPRPPPFPLSSVDAAAVRTSLEESKKGASADRGQRRSVERGKSRREREKGEGAKMGRKGGVEFDESPPDDFDPARPYADPVAMLEHLVREKWIHIETAKIIREHLQKCRHLIHQYLEATRGVGWTPAPWSASSA